MRKKAPKRRIIPLVMIVIGSIMLLGSVFAFMKAPAPTIVENAAVQPRTDIPFPRVNRINLTDAKAAYDLGEAIFIDTRGVGSYSQGHIPGALPITNNEILSRLNQFAPEDWIITYCT